MHPIASQRVTVYKPHGISVYNIHPLSRSREKSLLNLRPQASEAVRDAVNGGILSVRDGPKRFALVPLDTRCTSGTVDRIFRITMHL